MTHGRAAYTNNYPGNRNNEGLDDVGHPSWFLSALGWSAYGWTGARKIARTGGNLGEVNGPDNNADSIALFGSGMYDACHECSNTNTILVCSLMNDVTGNRRKVDADGKIIPMP
jgi:hypothetical protein